MAELQFWIDRDDFHAVVGGLAALTDWQLGHIELERIDAALADSWYVPDPDSGDREGIPRKWADFAMGGEAGNRLRFAADDCDGVGLLVTVEDRLSAPIANFVRPSTEYDAVLNGQRHAT